MPPQDALTDDDLKWITENAPDLANKLPPSYRRRLSQFKANTEPSIGAKVADATGRFMLPIVRGPFDAARFAYGIVSDPFNGFQQTGEILRASQEQVEKARQAEGEGRPMEGLLRRAASVPVVGPAFASIYDMAKEGDVAGAAGTTASMLLPLGRNYVKAGVTAAVEGGANAAARGARKVGLGPSIETAAESLNKAAENRMARAIAPQVGPNKARFGNLSQEIAPEIVRDPKLAARSMGGFDTKLDNVFESVSEALDQAAEKRFVSDQVNLRPVLAKLDAEIAKLQARPVEGSRLIPEYSATDPAVRVAKPGTEVTVRNRAMTAEDLPAHQRGYRTLDTGEFASEPTRTGRPIGQTVEPRPNLSELETLRTIRSELAMLGDVAPYESVRRIRQAWDKVAKVKYMPSTAQDVLKSQGDASGAAKGTGAMREALAEADPATADIYKQYSLYKTAKDIRAAAQEAERVRPNRLRGSIRTLASTQGITGITAAIVDRAIELAPDMQVMVARRMAGVADLLKKGDIQKAQAVLDRTVAQLPQPAAVSPAKRGWRVIKGGARTARRVGDLGAEAALAADGQDK